MSEPQDVRRAMMNCMTWAGQHSAAQHSMMQHTKGSQTCQVALHAVFQVVG